MGVGKILGSISPVAGAITGKGLFAPLQGLVKKGGLGGIALDALMKDKKKKKAALAGAVLGMAKGGAVKCTRGDGCAKWGKTRGRVC